jgi:hypothetical protein
MEEQIQTLTELGVAGLTAMTIYLTVVSGYLIVAYLAGDKLTTSQLVIVSSLFVVAALYLTFTTNNMFLAAKGYAASVEIPYPAWTDSVMLILQLAGIIASLKFMLDARKGDKTGAKDRAHDT